MQLFKNDELENKINDAVETCFANISSEIDDMEAGVFECFKLGEMLFDNDFMPLTNAITRSIFIQCFKQVFEAWSLCGTFESYISVFKKIFGVDADIVFTVPGAGQLNIAIATSQTNITDFIARTVSGNSWTYDNIVDENGDKIQFRTQKGIESQYELERVLFSMAPNGIYTQISLTVI